MPKTQEEIMPQAYLVDELSRHYGVEFTEDTDKEQFLEDCNAAAQKIAKERPSADQRREAMFEAKIVELRQMWDLPDNPDVETIEQQQETIE